MSSPTLSRRLAVTGVALLTLAAGVFMCGPAGAATADEVRVLQLVNQVRASAGAGPLVMDETLSVTARRWAATVAAAGRISHNPDLPVTTSGPTAIAENVGVGTTIQLVHEVLVASRSHYVNIVNPTVTRVGIGVVWSAGMVYVVQNFLIVRGATVPTAPPTTRPPTTSAPTTAMPAPPARPGATTTSVAPVSSPTLPTAQGPAPAGDGPSAWLILSFDVLRSWDRPSGRGAASG